MDLASESVISTQQQRKFSLGTLQSYQHRCLSYGMFGKLPGPSLVLEDMTAQGNVDI